MSYAPGDTLRIPVTGDTLTGLDGTTDPYGLYRDGTRDAAVTVTVTGAGGDWLATLTIPSGYSLGDTVWLKLLATTADGTYVVTSEPIVLADVQAAAAAAIAAAEPIDANVTQVAGVSAELIASLQQDVRDAMGLTSTSGEDSIDDKMANKTGYSLSATGLDAIADPDDLTPGSVPTTFSEKLRWLIQRFWKAEKSATVITVTNEAGDTITNQSVTSSGTNETLGAPE